MASLSSGPQRVGEVEVAQDDDRGLVLLGQVEGAVAGLEALLDRAGRDHDPWELAVRGVEHELEVRLLGAGRQTGRGPARCTSAITNGVSVMPARPSASTIKQKPPPELAVIARTPAWAAPIAIRIAAISSSVCFWTMPNLAACEASHSVIGAGRRHRIGRDELAAGGEGAQGDGLVAVHDHPLGCAGPGLSFQRKLSPY